jgi:prolyl oligopeptidase
MLMTLAPFAVAEPQRIAYPPTARGDQVDTYHGMKIADPYRWLEDDNSDATKAWVVAQNKVTFAYLSAIPQLKAIEARLTELWDYERYGLPQHRGERYFYTRNDGLQNQSVLLVSDALDGKPRELLDPNKLSDDGTIALASWAPSDNGKLLAYALSQGGSDWQTWHVRDVASGRDLEDRIEWSKFSGASWKPDSSGFFYAAYDAPPDGAELTSRNEFQKLFFHAIGTSQKDDVLVYQRRDEPLWGFDGEMAEDGKYLIISVWKGTLPKNQVFYQRGDDIAGKTIELITGFDAKYYFIGNLGDVLLFQTDHEAPLGRVIAIDTNKPDRKHWWEIIPQQKETLRGVSLVGGRLICQYLQDAKSRVRVFDVEGKALDEIQLPGLGTASGFGGRQNDKETFYAFDSFISPPTIYRYDIANGRSSVFRSPDVKFDSANYETSQVFFTSKDGTRVPVFISHKRGLKLDGQNPTILYGYGGFNIPLTPSFSVTNLVWMEMGGVYASANLRGGGEYGREWHEAGTKDRKQNVFDDFIAAAEYLIAKKYTSPQKLAIRGGSNGGLLVGAVMTQRPELFAAALPAVGVMDMLRYHKYTIGWAWVSDYGSAQDPVEFKNLLAYSPLHRLKAGVKYPATLITTGDHDDRVVPAHSFKFAAALQAAHAGDSPVLIRIETSGGHGAGTPTSKLIAEAADRLAFLVKVLDMK